MATTSAFPIRVMIAVLLLSITLSATGVRPTQAEDNSPDVSPQPTSLQATIDRNINLNKFQANGAFVVHFSEAMDTTSSPNPLLTYPYIDGTSSWDSQLDTLTFTPSDLLKPGETYIFFVDPGLTSLNNSAFDSTPQWNVYVNRGPRIKSVSPQSGTPPTRQPDIRVLFDQPMNRASVENSLSLLPELPHEMDWVSDKELEIRMKSLLDYGGQYTFLIAGGSANKAALDATGTPLATDYTWSYGIEEFSATLLPSTEKSVWLEFSHPLDLDRTGMPFDISPSLKGKWIWQGKSTIMFVAEEHFPPGQVFTLSVTGTLFDADGPVTLETVSFDFTAPPPIAFTNPSEQDNGIDIGFSPMEIAFETEVDKKSAEIAFSISPSVPGRLAWSRSKDAAFDDILSFHPSQLLEYQTQYTLTLGTDLADAQGKPLLLVPYTTTFSTRYAYDYYLGYENGASFGMGTKVQVVDANGSRRIQFGGDESGGLTFEAYAYDLIDFAALYSDYVNNDELPTPAKQGKEPLARWNYVEVNSQYQETIIPPEVPPGLYVLNLRHGGRSFDQLFVAITTNTIVAKQSGDELFVWVSNINGGAISEAEIRLYSNRGEVIREGKTDEDGLYRVSIPDRYVPMLVAARTGDNLKDIAVTGLNNAWREYANSYWWRRVETHKFQTYVYTERPIYRPGQIVNFKAIIRLDNDVKYAVPEIGMPVTINIRDPKKNLLKTESLLTSDWGTIHGTFTIAPEGSLGNYTVEVVVNDEVSAQVFKVQDYRKPDFKVTVQPADGTESNNYVSNDRIRAIVNAEYFFAEPVADAKVSFKMYRLAPRYYWQGIGAGDTNYSWYPISTFPGISFTPTDENGQTEVEFTARFAGDLYFEDYDTWGSSLRSRTFAIEVTVDDGSHQTVSSSYIFNVYNSEQKTTLDTHGYLKEANQPFSVEFSTKKIIDEPLAKRPLELAIHAWNSTTFDFDGVLQTHSIQTDENGVAQQELVLPSGYYKLILTGKDPGDRPVTYERWIKVLSPGTAWTMRYGDPITITAEKDEYQPYQTARFAIESTISGPALLTFERGSVVHSKQITLTAPLTIIEADIIPEDAPNIFVTVNAWEAVIPPSEEQAQWYRRNIPDSQLMMATTELKVSAEAKRLSVNISTEKEMYAPGDDVTVNISVKDSLGSPVRANVSLAVVDEAIYGLSNELEPSIFNALYGPRRWSVSTYSSMSPRRIIFDGGGRGGGGDGGTSETTPRDDFQDTAAWFPEIITDDDGRATIEFTLPDNITAWRLTAKAISINQQTDQAFITIETKKDLLLRPILPRVLTTGDQAGITAMLHNYSNAEQTAHVTLNGAGLKINGSATQSVTVKAGEVVAVGWSIVPEITTETNVRITASAGSMTDSVVLPLTIQPLAVKDIRAISGSFNGSTTLPLPLPPDLVTEASTVTLKLSRTPASSILDGLEYLTGYPYGCVEQTMSRAMPNAVLARASTQLGIGGEEFSARTKPLVEASIQKLYALQHGDGGWGWWYDDQSDPYQTAWVLHGLSNIRDAGHMVEPQVLEQGSNYLSYNLHVMDERTHAYALFSVALAGHGNAESAIALMNSSLQQLDPFSQAALALTLHRLGETKRADSILNYLAANAITKDGLTYWPQSTEDGEYQRKTMSSTIRTTAMALSAFTQIRGTSSLADSAASYLIQNRTGYGWGTTNETSFTIFALTDYLLVKQDPGGQSDYRIDLNGTKLSSGHLQAGNMFASVTIPVDMLDSGLNNIKITTTGVDPIFYDLVSSFSTGTTVNTPAGIVSVSRSYLDPKTNSPLTSIVEGQLVKVRLVVKLPETSSFVIVEDHLPGGLEALNADLNSTSQDRIQYDTNYFEEIFSWQDYGYNYKEIRGDRVSFFITELRSGEKSFDYFARAVSSGTFTALPAVAYAMYDDQVWGRSASTTVEIAKE